MAKQQNSEKITIANMVSVVGVVLLLVFTYIGYSYMSGGEIGFDILVSAGITGFTVFLLWFLIKAKSAENNLVKWKIAEFTVLAVYVIFSLSTAVFGGIMHFFVVNGNKDAIKNYAVSDLDKIEQLFNDYDTFESNALAVTATGLRNATAPRQVWHDDLRTFMNENHIAHDIESANNFVNLQREDLIGFEYESMYEEFQHKKSEIINAVDTWSAITIPSKANLIGKLAKAAEERLTELSQNAKLPVITQDASIRKYVIGDYQKETFAIAGGIENLEFVEALKTAEGFSVAALLIVLLIHTLVLFNYIAAFRTHVIKPGPDGLEEDGGRVL